MLDNLPLIELAVVVVTIAGFFFSMRATLVGIAKALKQNNQLLAENRAVLEEIRSSMKQIVETQNDSIKTIERIEAAMTRHEQENLKAHTRFLTKLESK